MTEEYDGLGSTNVIRIAQARVKDHLGKTGRGTVEDALNAMLPTEADRKGRASRYEHTEGCQDTAVGRRERSLHSRAGQVKLERPKLRCQKFMNKRRSAIGSSNQRK